MDNPQARLNLTKRLLEVESASDTGSNAARGNRISSYGVVLAQPYNKQVVVQQQRTYDIV